MKLLGHKRERELLERAWENARLPHALLFSGPEAVGKRLAALELADKILSSRKHFQEQPDLHLLQIEEEKRDISIEQIRELATKLQLKAYGGVNKVAIIDDAHLMSTAAQNALLLTLEEPPDGTFIIFISHLPQQLLPTILSRVQEFPFGALTSEEVGTILAELNAPPALTPQFIQNDLSKLDLSSFRKEKFFLEPNAAINKHLTNYVGAVSELEQSIARLLETESLTQLMDGAAKLGDKEQIVQTMRSLLEALRRKLRSEADADKLLLAIEVERLISERSLNSTLQLSNLLLKFSSKDRPPLPASQLLPTL